MLGNRRKKEIERLRKRNAALLAESEALVQILNDADEQQRKLQLQVWDLERKLAQERKNSRQLECRLRSELWQNVQEILTGKGAAEKFAADGCDCIHSLANGTWEVVTDEENRGLTTAVFCSEEDACRYYSLYQVFRMRAGIRASMQGYLDRLKKSA